MKCSGSVRLLASISLASTRTKTMGWYCQLLLPCLPQLPPGRDLIGSSGSIPGTCKTHGVLTSMTLSPTTTPDGSITRKASPQNSRRKESNCKARIWKSKVRFPWVAASVLQRPSSWLSLLHCSGLQTNPYPGLFLPKFADAQKSAMQVSIAASWINTQSHAANAVMPCCLIAGHLMSNRLRYRRVPAC